ncbi:PI-actitoxin-Afv2a [Rhagoletis pomonella]|uniref:PI-actitoxin-Afv2a n=1 Tax=Rhagoletis pomonella TaxID=28610 RepID=UPI0017803FB9|nr:PI-actitoxin-Afv2a [Rhagoletis pomonella]
MHAKIILFLTLIIYSLFACSQAERPAHCLLAHPKGYGLCDMLIIGFYYNAERNVCEQWSEDGCGVEGGHSYDFKEDCERECIERN